MSPSGRRRSALIAGMLSRGGSVVIFTICGLRSAEARSGQGRVAKLNDQINLSGPDVGPQERALLLDAFDSNWIAPIGPHIDGFERDVASYVGVGHAAALSSGTASIHLALRLLGVGAGDSVLVSTLTFVGSVAPVIHLGAKPVFVDCNSETWNMDPTLLEETLDRAAAIGKTPSAVIVVDVYGQCADYGRIVSLCRQYGVPIIEDAAEALGATYHGQQAGSFGEVGIFSFNGNKIVTTSGGGMLVSNDGALVERAVYLASQARLPAPHYEHDEIGFNYRMSNLCAALGRAQLQRLGSMIARRRAIFDRYRQRLGEIPGFSFMPESPHGTSTRWLTVAMIDPEQSGVDRDEVRKHLATQGIEARPAWKPMHMQPVFASAAVVGGAVSEEIFARGLCLPSGSGLSDKDIGRVIDCILGVTERSSGVVV